jgi:hypothetical protein
VMDPGTWRVVRHIEEWDVEPGRVVAQLFKPAAKARQGERVVTAL